ncbi:conserved Plasmodium protein, unknown function [Plasmodium gallinaceum]|uniref:Uncharacterized protein n=1 Tax=Plasmodium gallinaceum TaxID=5849 RepID=A0A1J1GXV9_PLAGA|nr:conserved Plasmodium protein, unknown function [Plasmodium gallinaceum]CRG95840.1 conserved Plasmodium protein, unknown function [Plasmodium gallinaceum]
MIYIFILIFLLKLWKKIDCQSCYFRNNKNVILSSNIKIKNKKNYYYYKSKHLHNDIKNIFAKAYKVSFNTLKKEDYKSKLFSLKEFYSNYFLLHYINTNNKNVFSLSNIYNNFFCKKNRINLQKILYSLKTKRHSYSKKKILFIPNKINLKNEKYNNKIRYIERNKLKKYKFIKKKCYSESYNNLGYNPFKNNILKINENEKYNSSEIFNAYNYYFHNENYIEINDNYLFSKFFLFSILKSSLIYSYTKEEYMKRLMKEIWFLFYKLYKINLNGFDRESELKENMKIENINKQNILENTKFDEAYSNSYKGMEYLGINEDFFLINDYKNTKNHYICSFHNNKNTILIKNWLCSLHCLFIKQWVDRLVNFILKENFSNKEFSKNNLIIKCENNIQKKLFFHLQCFYFLFTKEKEDDNGYLYIDSLYNYRQNGYINNNCYKKNIVSENKEKNMDKKYINKENLNENVKYISQNDNVTNENIIIYIYRNNENIEKYYKYLKNIYKKESVSFFNYDKYIHNDNSFFIMLISYEEFFNISYFYSSTFENFKKYINSKTIFSEICINLFQVFSCLLKCSSYGNKELNRNSQNYKFKIFFDDFNLKYNYEVNIIEKNIYEHLFSLLNINEKMTFYFLSTHIFNLSLFKIWIASIHKNCSTISLTKKKNFFILHKKLIFRINNNDEINKSNNNDIKLNNNIENEEKMIFNMVKNKKKNVLNKQVTNNLLIFNKFRKDIIVKYLKENNLYNINKLKKKDKKLKRKFNIAKRYLKKKKIYNFNISRYIDFIISKNKKGDIFFKKIINPSYILKEENLQKNDKINILTNNLYIAYNNDTFNKEREDLKFSQLNNDLINLESKNKNLCFQKNYKLNILKINEKNKENKDEKEKANYLLEEEKKKSIKNTYIWDETDVALKKNLNYNNKYRFFYLNKVDIKKEHNIMSKINFTKIYPCIYYIFNLENFLLFSEELYEQLNLLDEHSVEKCEIILKKYEGKINVNNKFKMYLFKGLFLVSEKLNIFQKALIKELLKRGLIKIIISCINISSDGFSVQSVFLDSVHININKKLKYNYLIDLINNLHDETFYSFSENSDINNKNKTDDNVENRLKKLESNVNISEDMYRLHFVKYFMYLNFRYIFRKYTLSNNDILNLSKNSINFFLIPQKYEDISIILNTNNNNYLNFSNMHKHIIRDFYFNMYYIIITKSISIHLKFLKDLQYDKKLDKKVLVNDLKNNTYNKNYKDNSMDNYIRKNNINNLNMKQYFFRSKMNKYNFFNNYINNIFDSNFILLNLYNIINLSLDFYKIYKFNQLNAFLFIKNYINICNNLSYLLNYYEFLYFYFINNKDFEKICESSKNNFFNFLLMKRTKYEKEFIKHNKEHKLDFYQKQLKKICKYFDEDHIYMYYNTYINYNKLKKRFTKKLKILYKEKYDMLYINIKNNFKKVVLSTIDKKLCIILDIYKVSKKYIDNLYICLNDSNELFICKIFFFAALMKNNKFYKYIKKKSKKFNYFNYLFNSREVTNYKIFIKEYDFLFDIYKEENNNKKSIISNKNYIFEFFVNKISLSNEFNKEEKRDCYKLKEKSQDENTEKVIDIYDILFNSYNESIYNMNNRMILFLKKMRNMKRKLYIQYLKQKDMQKKKKRNLFYFSSNSLNEHYNLKLCNKNEEIKFNDLKEKKVIYEKPNELSKFIKDDYFSNNEALIRRYFYNNICRNNEEKKNIKIFVYENLKNLKKNINNDHKLKYSENKNKKILLDFKSIDFLNLYKKKKNIGNRNNYLNEINQINRIFGCNTNTFNKEFSNIFLFLNNFNLIDILKKYMNPYIKNSLWFYIITLYINHIYSLNKNEIIMNPELLITIFYICFYENKYSYLDNYISSFHISNIYLKNIVADIFIYKELLSSLQFKFKIHIDITFNLIDLCEVFESLTKLRKKNFKDINENIIGILTKLNLILYNVSSYFNKDINEIILSFINYINEMKKYKEVT